MESIKALKRLKESLNNARLQIICYRSKYYITPVVSVGRSQGDNVGTVHMKDREQWNEVLNLIRDNPDKIEVREITPETVGQIPPPRVLKKG